MRWLIDKLDQYINNGGVVSGVIWGAVALGIFYGCVYAFIYMATV